MHGPLIFGNIIPLDNHRTCNRIIIKKFLETERQIRGMWESCEGTTGHICAIFFISDVTIRCENVYGAPHNTELIHMIFFMWISQWIKKGLMDTLQVSRTLLVGKTWGFPINHYGMRHVHIAIYDRKCSNRYQKIWIVANFHKESKIDTFREREILDMYGS